MGGRNRTADGQESQGGPKEGVDEEKVGCTRKEGVQAR